MKKLFGVFVSVLLAAQAMLIPAMAQVDDVKDVVDAEVETQADVVFTYSDVMCSPGDEIAVDISMESSVVVNSVALSNLTYDADRLEFLGFGNPGELIQKSFFGELGIDRELNTIVLGYMSAGKLSGRICSLMFKVKDGYGVAEVSMDAVVKNNADEYSVSTDAALVAAGHVDFSLGNGGAAPGGKIHIPLTVNTDVPVNSIALSDLVYDTDALVFEGFANYGKIVTESLFGTAGMDEELQAITVGLLDSVPVSGKICDLVFTVKEDAPIGSTTVSMTPIVKNYSEEIYSSLTCGTAAVGSVELILGCGCALPGETVDVPVYLGDIDTDADELWLGASGIDNENISFVGYVVNDELITDKNLCLTGLQSMKEEDYLCSVRVAVSENAEGMIEEFKLHSWLNDGAGTKFYPCDFVGVVSVGKTDIVIGNAEAAPGDVVELDFVISGTAPIGSVEVMSIVYDTAAMTFEGFTFDSDKILDYGYFTGDDGSVSLTVLFAEGAMPAEIAGKMTFRINEDAEDGTATVTPGNVYASAGMIPFLASFDAGSVEIQGAVCGDLGGDATVDLQDALLLFQNIMLPDLYPIEYKGTLDFKKDGVVDIHDALRLYQHAMLPDLYPIEW